tara:strand:- start:3717 stop:4220 length:504 start_codon:yes stop_codon:yes gene_type:complete
MHIEHMKKGLGPLPVDEIDVPSDHYCIVHQQAPTSENKDSTIHPAILNGHVLWHNGIIKEKEVQRLQRELNTKESWDTKLMIDYISTYGEYTFDGTYACVYHNGTDLYFFRNEISPLFVDERLNISSTLFKNSQALKPNTVFKIQHEHLNPDASFETKENPYYFGAA